MLYILLVIGIILLIVGICSDNAPVFGLGIIIGGVSLFCTLIAAALYNKAVTTVDARQLVLEEQNQIVLSQIKPLVQQALEYESNTYKDFKLDAAKVIAFTQLYPELKANDFLNKQIDIILANQEEIKQLKLDKASLNAYHFWLWTPKVN
jgi:DNA-dependent RNA polymerase auxiliary subunit epsilon